VLKTGQVFEFNFLQTKNHRISDSKKLLIHYHNQGIFTWLELLNVLKITDYDEIQRFKEEVS
jgi:hypothetical protein